MSIGDKLVEAYHNIGIAELRLKVYGLDYHNEIEGMRKFIESRQDWCKDNILKSLEK
jgi:hypothetical protein